MAIITIIGAGMMGSALAFPAVSNGHNVRLVGTPLDSQIIDECIKKDKHPKFDRAFPQGIEYYHFEEMQSALTGADLLIGGISSFGVDWFLDVVLMVIPEKLPVIVVTKGLKGYEDGRLESFPDYWAKKLKKFGRKISISAITGPCTSYELVAEDNTVVTFCGYDEKNLELAKNLLETDYYHISLSKDVIGCEAAVALKNLYALSVTMTIGLNQSTKHLSDKEHYNSQAAVFGQSVKEMRRFIAYLGGGDDAVDLGTGDLYVTVFGGRTRLLGKLLGRGTSKADAENELAGITLESVAIAETVARAMSILSSNGKIKLEQFSLFEHTATVLNGEKQPSIPWKKLF